jgi:superfamily II DNA or RNA helicase
MSLKYNIDNISYNKRKQIHTDLKFESNISGKGISKIIFPYEIIKDDIYLPFYFGNNIIKIKRPERNIFSQENIKFKGKLREEQEEVKKETINNLNKFGTSILSLYVGGGKTITSINIACSIKLKTLIIVNKIVLINQWRDSINQFCENVNICILNSKTPELDMDCQFYIINAINIEKLGHNFFKDIGFCILDETHTLLSSVLYKSLFYIQPRYLLALSATAYRLDGYNELFDFFFGNKIVLRDLNREHTVYKINTKIDIEIETDAEGRVLWNNILNKQSQHKERNLLIIDIIKMYKDRTFLVLCKRIEQAQLLYDLLLDNNESVDHLIGTKQEFDKNVRVLIGITSKVGCGFDWPKLDAMILAADIESFFIQTLGRIFRKKDTIPIVFDLVDNNFVLIKHFKSREEIYKKCGGKIQIFKFQKKFLK